MANTTKPTDLTVFELLEALTGELPWYASPTGTCPTGRKSSQRTAFQVRKTRWSKLLACRWSVRHELDHRATHATGNLLVSTRPTIP